MEEQKKKCCVKEHKDIDAAYYCQECKIYICNKCFYYHQAFFQNHQINNIDNNIEIFIDKCKEKNHPNKLEFYCKNHNQLCCVLCISKIKAKDYGQHKDCEVCLIEDIREEKKNKLKDNIKYLEDLSKDLNYTIKELKLLFKKNEEKKEEIKLKIQKIFTQIRTALNEREDELLSEVDKKFVNLFGEEDIIKESEKLPNKIKTSLEKGKLLDNDWNDNNKLSFSLNNCIDIEDNIKKINIINNNIQKCKLNKDVNISFNIDDDYLNNYLKNIKTFGCLNDLSNIDSVILKNKDDLTKFINLLSTKIKINNTKLLYRFSRDGLQFNNIKNKINNKSNLIFLFSTGDIRIFGSFIKAKVEIDNNEYIKDDNAFVFSLNNNRIYKILVPELAIRFSGEILIGNNGNSNGFYFSGKSIYDQELLNNPKVYDFQRNNELTEGNSKFNELEIFEINYLY